MMFKILVPVLASVLVYSSVAPAAETTPTCHHGDVVMGPNCVAIRTVAPEDGDKAVSAVTMSRVYRPGKNGSEVTVWSGLGQVIRADKDKLHVQVWYVVRASSDGKPRPDVKIEFDSYWDGTKYDDVRVTEEDSKK